MQFRFLRFVALFVGVLFIYRPVLVYSQGNVEAALASIDSVLIRTHLATLSDDRMEGRADCRR